MKHPRPIRPRFTPPSSVDSQIHECHRDLLHSVTSSSFREIFGLSLAANSVVRLLMYYTATTDTAQSSN